MSGLLGLESLDIWRLRTDVLLVYRIMFGMVRLNSNEFFALRNQPHLRGHKYVTNKQRCSNNRRNNFFSNRIVNLWNNLPSSTTNFTSFRKFDKSLNINDYLLLYCKLRLNFCLICKLLFPTHDFLYIYCIHWVDYNHCILRLVSGLSLWPFVA